ncbi:SDR family NAD(P)-dependent oxidoreductase [Nakamurella lactea]|uniref:SDR family NAD(P)-dependent oxidoreductase n=1 Tax=Nakamurella lactea TaxID=459515 RepID=UPI000683D674|nr:SDR family oxidoreductase [Nakamurella lactea]
MTRAPVTTPLRPDKLFDLNGRVAVVTGGGTHLGAAMAGALAAAGARVHLMARNGARCQRVANGLSESGFQAQGHECDVTDSMAVERVVGEITADSGRLDVLVANAGGSSARGPFTELTDVQIRSSMELNVLGTAACIRSAAWPMIAAGAGSIILIGSIHSSLGSDRRAYDDSWEGSAADYHIAKGAIVNMARALAMEWATTGVRVNCLSPGQIPKSSLPAPQAERFRESIPIGRLGEPDDLAGAVLLLASDAGSFITGHNLIVDGGWSAR